MDDRFSLMHISGASLFAAAFQSLPGGVSRRLHHLTALPGLHLNQLSAKIPQKNPSVPDPSTCAFKTHSDPASLSIARFALARFY